MTKPADSLVNVALDHLRQDLIDAAESLLQQAIEVDSRNIDAHHFLGIVHLKRGAIDKACKAIVHSLYLQLGVANVAHRELPWAEQVRRLLTLQAKPDQLASAAWNNLGEAIRGTNEAQLALECFRESLRHDEQSGEAWINLSTLLQASGDSIQALEACQQALKIRGDCSITYRELGNCLRALNRLDEAYQAYQRAIAINPFDPNLLNNFGVCCRQHGRIQEAIDAFHSAYRLNPSDLDCGGNWLMTNLNDPRPTIDVHIEQHRSVGSQLQAVHRRFERSRINAFRQRLRVGYLSADFCAHAVNCFFEPILAHHDRESIETVLFSGTVREDFVTQRLRSLADHFHDIRRLSDQALSNAILEQEIDVLVDLTGHTAGSRLGVLALRSAPIQLSYLGYPFPPFTPNIDGWIGDGTLLEGLDEHFKHLELIRLTPCFCAFQTNYPAPSITVSKTRSNGYVTFGSLHQLVRINDELIAVWSEIIRRVDGSRLLIFRDSLRGSAVERIIRSFKRHGIDAQRLILACDIQGTDSHLAVYNEIDITLDSFPWSGHTTGCESLWMGVPVITLYGSSPHERMVSSILKSIELEHWIAYDRGEYIAKAVALANNVNDLEIAKTTLRSRFADSRVGQGRHIAAQLERIYREWRQRIA